jgi:hypothetical protein
MKHSVISIINNARKKDEKMLYPTLSGYEEKRNV